MGDEQDPAVGRLPAAEQFLDAAGRGPAGLLIEGEAGIGKTTVWEAVAARAGRLGFCVLRARTEPASGGVAYGVIADLLAAFSAEDPAVLAALPGMQRTAADRVLQRDRAAAAPMDERVVAAALLGAAHATARSTPVLIAVDDVQWLDPSSLAVLAFVARRLRGPVGVAVTERTDGSTAHPAAEWLQVGTGAVTRFRVPPMSLGALHAMLSSRLGRRFSRPAIVRIAEVSGGNPLYALELARVVDGGEMRLPATLTEAVRLRVAGLPAAVRDVLLVAASTADPTVDLLATATATTVADITRLLEPAEVDGIVAIEGNRIRFTHPLLAGGIYDNAEPSRRRAIHRRLAEINTDPERRARHLALAATDVDETTLATLDDAADSARARGAPAAAAELLELALGLGGDTVSRRIRAAEHHYVAGELLRAAALLDDAIGDLRPGTLRAVALNLRAGVRIFEDDYAGAVSLLERASDDAADSPAVLVSTLVALAFAQGMVGALDEQVPTARRAVQVAEAAGVPALLSRALAMHVHVSCQAGFGLDEKSLQRAVALQDDDDYTPVPFLATATRGLMLGITGHLAEAEEQLAQVAERCLQRGAEQDVLVVTGYRALVAIWRGRYDDADRHASDMMERAGQLGGSMVVANSISAAVAAYRGQESRARRCAHAALSQGAQYPPLTVWASTALTFLAVSRGNATEAAELAEPLVDLYRPFTGTELMTCCFVPDTVEAFVASGRVADAEELVRALERNGARLDRPWMLAVGGRCRGLLAAARGDLPAALAALQRALVEHDRLPMPFERARTQLALGEVLRAMRRRDAARDTIREALRQFDALGVPLWSERARKALAGRADAAELLSESELRVAQLVASGKSNREVAEALYVSVKTVETNLTRAYRKLGIRSRAQLGKALEALEDG